jgi:anti-sigma-K factor RskA
MADSPLTLEERDSLAGELALGVLEGQERADALRLRLAEPAFAAAVDVWEGRLAPLYDAYAPALPQEGVWQAISTRVEGEGKSVMWQLRLWRTGAVTAAAIAASLALILMYRVPAPTPVAQPTVVAVAQMVGAPNGPVVTASYDPAQAMLSLRATGLHSGRLAPELWVIPADGKPRSLGMIPASGTMRMSIGPAHRTMLADGSMLAITMETPSTAPHDAPGSAPVASGRIVRI